MHNKTEARAHWCSSCTLVSIWGTHEPCVAATRCALDTARYLRLIRRVFCWHFGLRGWATWCAKMQNELKSYYDIQLIFGDSPAISAFWIIELNSINLGWQTGSYPNISYAWTSKHARKPGGPIVSSCVFTEKLIHAFIAKLMSTYTERQAVISQNNTLASLHIPRD